MNKILFGIVVFCLASCKVTLSSQSVEGNYVYKIPDHEYYLTLSGDHLFTYAEKYLDANPHCTGKWYSVAKRKIMLSCQESTNPANWLTRDYMNGRKLVMKMIDQDNVRIGKIILQRVK